MAYLNCRNVSNFIISKFSFFCRLGSRSVGFIRSEAEVEEIVDNLREIDASEKQMHLMAVPTPHLMNKYERRVRYIDNNGLIRDVEQFRKERNAEIIWSEKEKQTFRETFALFPKDFEKIADFLELKSCADCVLFYYRHKKKENFKSSKLKPKKKGKLNRTGQLSLKPDHKQKQTNKQGKENNIEIEVEEEEDDSLLSEEENVNTLAAVVMPTSMEAGQQNIAENDTMTNVANPINELSKIITQFPVKVINTRSGKNLQKTLNIAATTKPVVVEPSVDENITSTESSHPPLKITIVVTSPSNAKSSTTVASVASIVSETVTAAASMIVDQVPNENTSSECGNSMKVEDLIKQHLNKMPGLNVCLRFLTSFPTFF